MPCLAIRRWTFSGLVGAFLDLSITFFLLCASALAYFASKFLAFFGLNLPCPCNGFFAIPDASNNCLQRQFVDYPLQKISSIQSSVKSKFPFDSIGNRSQWKSNLENYRNIVKNEVAGSEGESSCISSSVTRAENSRDGDLAKMKEKGFVMGAMNLQDVKERKFDCKWKGLLRHRSRNNLRRRRKDNGKLSQVSSFKSLWSDAETPQSPPARIRNETCKDGMEPLNYRGTVSEVNCYEILDGKEGSVVDIGSKRKISQGFELYEPVDENETSDHENTSDLDGNARNTIRLLELALEEEHAARAVLYVELEKERSAAATAADEAMAMIQRLQKEKALIEMEARQCQRMIEEKYAYDAEEMNILKEILLRREREKYFLEKEVEAYRQAICNEQFEADNTSGYWYPSDEDLGSMMPQKIGDSTSRKYKGEKETFKELPSIKLSEDDISSIHGDIAGHSSLSDEESIQQKACASPKLIQTTTSLVHKAVDKESVHDIHVIEDQSSMSKQVIEDKNKQLLANASTLTHTAKIGRTSSIIPSGLPPIGSSRGRSMRSEMRRKSMSAFDAERYKIDNEIIWLRERLRSVQEGREKLKFSKGSKEGEKTQLQMLEDITNQLQEIRQLTEPGKALRRASLPPLTSNVMSKKRRWRSGPLLLEGSI
ncbi:probable myosin-binding protein 6 isoform X1 [Ricinus communis]|uniref:probable myosin-binding protein 6 isoform X1 n=1 Tax=Ricinus communis TaxID=3988 RepID=UPI00201A3B1B|nr:probable myosin-binding protein 6 isoform X1 [Ricinus communis]